VRFTSGEPARAAGLAEAAMGCGWQCPRADSLGGRGEDAGHRARARHARLGADHPPDRVPSGRSCPDRLVPAIRLRYRHKPAPRGHTLAAVIGAADVRRARLYLHRAEDDLTVATASLRDADLTATVRDELAGLGGGIAA
jgi:hypothetical protein